MKPSPEQVEAGHAFYTKRTLAVYDLMILGYFSRVAWKCPASRILAHYNQHVTSNHLDVGVGTGYFLDRCRFESSTPRIALMDLNPSCLETAARRIARYGPERHQANVLEPIEPVEPKFDSIGLNYLLHCLPGTIASKGIVFERLEAVANPSADVFGATLLHGGVPRSWMARKVMDRNNARGIFCNAEDDLDGLRAVVSAHLSDTTVEVVGCVALFAGRT